MQILEKYFEKEVKVNRKDNKDDTVEISGGIYFYCPIYIQYEMNDKELREIIARSNTYKFWDSPEEDIYSVSDGEPL